MRAARRQHRAIPRPQSAATQRGMSRVLQALYGANPTLPADVAEQQYAQLCSSRPYERKRQGDLVLVLPEPDTQ